MFLKQFGKKPNGERLNRIKNSLNYKNGSFQNIEFTPTFSEHFSVIKMFKAYVNPTSKKPVPVKPIPHVKSNLNDADFDNYLVWMGHSSYFLKVDGLNILVGPVLSGNASPFKFLVKNFEGSNPFSAEDIPEIDILIITHDHYDHLDYRTIVKILPKVKKVITSLGVGTHLEFWKYKPEIIFELDWFDRIELTPNLSITATPARHFSGRLLKRNQTLFSSFVLKSDKLNLFLGGDSGYGNHFKTIGEKFGPFDFAILESGQYNLFWKNIHAMPDEMITIIEELKAKKVIPVHSSKFKLALHDWDEPLNELSKNTKEKTVQLLTPRIGEIMSFFEEKIFIEWWKE